MAGLLQNRYDDIEVELIEGSGGAFEVRRGGELVFSKLSAGRFPDDAEVFSALDG